MNEPIEGTFTPEKMELVRTALPKGLAAGDGNLSNTLEQYRSEPSVPQPFASSTLETQPVSKLNNAAEPDDLEVSSPSRQGSKPLDHPFRLIERADENGVQIFGVDPNSSIYKSFGNFTSVVTINGLNDFDERQSGYVVLEGLVTNGVAQGGTILWGESDLGERATYTGTSPNQVQTKYRLYIGYLYSDGLDQPSILILQNSHSNYTLTQACVNGVVTLTPVAT